MKILRIIFFILVFAGSQFARAPEVKLRGLRIDTAYFYNLYADKNVEEITEQIIKDAKKSVANTLFVYAYNSVYGALYPTNYPYTEVERGYGRLNILKSLAEAAHKNGLKIIAVVPVNNFKVAWLSHPSWRAQKSNGQDYVPLEGMYLLSAWHPEFKLWLAGFYRDLLNRNPEIDGIEAVEPSIDYNWAQETDYNPVATEIFRRRFTNSPLGGEDWLNFRARGLTELIAILNRAAYNFNKGSYLVQSWPVKADGSLFHHLDVKKNTGLDMDGILNLKGREKITYFMVELIWQQWVAEYGPKKFSKKKWTRRVSLEFIDFVQSRSEPLIHVELSPFTGTFGKVTPTPSEFGTILNSLNDLNVGIEVYDHSQVSKLDAWDELFRWYDY